MVSSEFPVLYVDGNCVMCTGAVKTVLKYEKNSIIKFAALDSAVGRAATAEYFNRTGVKYDSIMLQVQDKVYFKSQAVCKVMELTGIYPFAVRLLQLIPQKLADFVYDLVARNRHFLGRTDICSLQQLQMNKSRLMA
jgi:predicted DCC family thiol-disulfide oxidoreductase YuxK